MNISQICVLSVVLPVLLLMSGNVRAGNEFDKCIQDEKSLKAEETSSCSGLNYVFNPNACFATRKELKKYTSTDKCTKIGIVENVDVKTPPVAPVEQVKAKDQVDINKAAPEIQSHKSYCEQLKDENILLKEEVYRLIVENEQLRKTGR
ncbi:MAG: hypothetical protein HXX17_01915 [Geobacteraceae bacterium]|nr:hypothetical protein [Geobacteraceae bacterium]